MDTDSAKNFPNFSIGNSNGLGIKRSKRNQATTRHYFGNKRIEAAINFKELNSPFGGIQVFVQIHRQPIRTNGPFETGTDENTKWVWTEEHTVAIKNLKQMITEIPCLAQYNPNYPYVITTNASSNGIGATLWQDQLDRNLKPIGFASRLLSDTKKKCNKRN